MFRTTESKSQTQPEAPDSAPGHSVYQSSESNALPSESAKAVAESATIAREIREGTLSAFVGTAASITGQAAFKSMFRVDGQFSGRISSTEGTLVVAAGGRVEANVAVAIAKIQGILIGDIIAVDRIELGRTAQVTGNIQAPSLMIEPGAVLDGSCRMLPQEVVAEPEVVSEPAIAAEQKAADEPKTAAAPEAVSEPEITAEKAPVSEPEMAAEQAAATQPATVAEPEKPLKVERKENVLGTKGRRTRTKAATAKTEDDESAAAAMAG